MKGLGGAQSTIGFTETPFYLATKSFLESEPGQWLSAGLIALIFFLIRHWLHSNLKDREQRLKDREKRAKENWRYIETGKRPGQDSSSAPKTKARSTRQVINRGVTLPKGTKLFYRTGQPKKNNTSKKVD